MTNRKEKKKWLLMASILQIIEEVVAYFRNFMYLCTRNPA
jgi:hypothetical protein